MINPEELKTAVDNLNTLLTDAPNVLALNDQELKDVKECVYFTMQHQDKLIEDGKALAPEKTKAFADRIEKIFNAL